MAVDIDFSGGDSVYCINESQLKQAHYLAQHDPESAPRIRETIERLQDELSRNERAAVAFVLIEELLKGAGTDIATEKDVSAVASPLSQFGRIG